MIAYTFCFVVLFLVSKTANAFSVAPQQQQWQQQRQALDILQDLDGNPISTDYFSQAMGLKDTIIESYTCPEKEAFRGFMSNGCRVHFYPGNHSAFYKRIDFSNLNHSWEKFKSAPHKIKRDLESYHVVAAFLTSRACQQFTTAAATTVHIPKCYHAQLRPNHSNPMKSKFTFLLEDLNPKDGWYQRWLLQDLEETRVVLSVYAKMHAFFWTGSNFWNNDNKDAAMELEKAVWKSASYVQPEAQGMDQCKTVKKEWASKRLRFMNDLSSFDYWENLGERLENVAQECGYLAHPFAQHDKNLSNDYWKYRTFTHGDPKQANIFFRRQDSADKQSSVLQVGLIDFQWSGFGLAATDIAHFITSAVHADLLVDGGEERLLLYYFKELQKYLVEYGVYETAEQALENYSYGTFLEQYEIGVLDICRLVIAYTWARFDGPIDLNDKEGQERTMNLTSYNKSLPNVVWLMSRCDEILNSWGI